MKNEISAMRVAGITCAIVLALIAYFSFTLPNDQFIGYLTQLGETLGGGTTYGVLILAVLPPLSGCICYFLWKWLIK
ncbi:hypothetical protein ACT2CV_07930 [Pasteurellaceae bacterium 22721_9_1]